MSDRLPASHAVYYVTNRRHKGRDRWKPRGYSGRRCSDDGVENLRFGKVEFELDDERVNGLLAGDSGFGPGHGEALKDYIRERLHTARIQAFPENLDRGRSDTSQDRALLGSTRMFEELRQEQFREHDVLVFVHGFNVSWWSAVASAAALERTLQNRSSRRKIKVVLFTWPSNGRALPWVSYRSDRADAAATGGAIGRGFLKLRDFLSELRQGGPGGEDERCMRRIHLLCHSMGNYVLQHAIARTVAHSPAARPPRLWDHVFLSAPDVAEDVLEPGEPLGRLPEMARSVTVYHNEGDVSMWLSDHTKGNTARLGWSGASRPGRLDHRVHMVDCSEIVTGAVEHGYHLSGWVNEDIAKTIDGVRPNGATRRREPVASAWAERLAASTSRQWRLRERVPLSPTKPMGGEIPASRQRLPKGSITQPTIRRLKPSSTTARYRRPRRFGTCVMSATPKGGSGASALERLLRDPLTLGADEASASGPDAEGPSGGSAERD